MVHRNQERHVPKRSAEVPLFKLNCGRNLSHHLFCCRIPENPWIPPRRDALQISCCQHKWLICGTSAGVAIGQARRSLFTATTLAETAIAKGTAEAGHHWCYSSCCST